MVKKLVCPHCNGTGHVPDDRVVGRKKRAERIKVGLSLREMAYRMCISPAYLSDLELGRRHWGPKQLGRFSEVIDARLMVSISEVQP